AIINERRVPWRGKHKVRGRLVWAVVTPPPLCSGSAPKLDLWSSDLHSRRCKGNGSAPYTGICAPSTVWLQHVRNLCRQESGDGSGQSDTGTDVRLSRTTGFGAQCCDE